MLSKSIMNSKIKKEDSGLVGLVSLGVEKCLVLYWKKYICSRNFEEAREVVLPRMVSWGFTLPQLDIFFFL